LLEVIVALTLLLTNAGESQKEVVCTLELVKRESNYNLHSTNSTSGAYGLFQLMRVDRKLSMQQQVDRYQRYIKHRYSGNSCLALSKAKRVGWY
jgi:hypothetical protein